MRLDDYRVATLATVPDRITSLHTALRTLRPQVDEICVMLNGHEAAPECVNEFGCTYAFAAEHGDKGDAGKFFWAGKLFGAHTWNLTCDDDFAYHPGYADHLVDAAMRLEAAVSLHGVVLHKDIANGRPISWLKAGRKRVIFARDLNKEDVPVHVLGTGVACFHTSMIAPAWSDFPQRNSADIYFSALCQAKRIPRFVPRHPQNLATATAPPLRNGPKQLRRSGAYAERVAAKAPWVLHTEQS